MSTKPTAPETKNKKKAVKTGLSTFTKILLTLFLILAIFVVWFVFHAWQVLNSTSETTEFASQASFEVLTPTGAPVTGSNVPTPVFSPNPAIAASESTEPDTASEPALPATTGRANTRDRATPENTQEIRPITPTNVPAATNRENNSETPVNTAPTTKPKPAANGNNGKPLDNLF
ncbi:MULTISPECIES: hypothetical protein [Snodgrassella]|uniref:Uncharacterized protein n=1 Tax=Snodgrassella alvi TaxID=1196083 RepID=A0ABD7Z3Y0_9NEIS|nr:MULTISPECIES: hypothetical protein [Snodgrassella]AHN27964.1 hypothetical protein SALWKB2_0582 [Snodgrassella alvi wkB2]MBI0129917.1 hypothetical protein [Snodgrassella sp. W8124]MBI0164431.1 hypothetical protein [Snodgrassella sp. M0351]NUF08892.1 hypothetical protein [Snodgrassella sp. ESL0324]OOX78875.1 hypothetical protein BGH94_06560 [Snodgrassella alvi]